MSSETREFRPYKVNSKLTGALSGSSFRFGSQVCQAEGSILVDDRTFSQRTGSIIWADEECFEQFKLNLRLGSADSGYDPSLLALIVVIRSGYLKSHEVALNISLSEIEDLERVTPITTTASGERWAALDSDTHGTFVEVYVALSQDLHPKPLCAHRKSTWLAKTTFRVRCEADNALFRPMPLDDAKRDELNRRDNVKWYDGTMFFVEFDSGCELTADLSETEVPILWVDEELLTTLDQHRSSPAAALIQHQMVLHLVTSVVYEFARQATGSGPEGVAVELDTLTYQELSGSLIGRIARMIAGPKATPDQRNEVLSKMRTNPLTATAWVESQVDLRSSLMASFISST